MRGGGRRNRPRAIVLLFAATFLGIARPFPPPPSPFGSVGGSGELIEAERISTRSNQGRACLAAAVRLEAIARALSFELGHRIPSASSVDGCGPRHLGVAPIGDAEDGAGAGRAADHRLLRSVALEVVGPPDARRQQRRIRPAVAGYRRHTRSERRGVGHNEGELGEMLLWRRL